MRAAAVVPASSAIVVREDGKILVQKRGDNGRFGLPGGAVEVGESLTAATLREVLEETGLEVEIVRLTGLYSDPVEQLVSYPDGNVVQHVSANFECRIVAGTLTTSAESPELLWVDPRSLPEPFVPQQRPRVADWLSFTGVPFVR